MHLAVLPEERAGRDPSGACVADDAVTLDNAAFAARVRGAAAVLRARGTCPGDVVAVMLPNRVELVVILFAAWRLGAAVTPVNPALTADEAGFQIRDAGARVVVGEAGAELVTLDVAALEGPDSTGVRQAGVDEGDLGPAVVDDTALALLIYTSGTTGRPKGVMLDHANVRAMVDMIVTGLGLGPRDHSLLILPLFHVNGIAVSVLSPLLAGGRATVAGRFRPETFFDVIERVRPTYFSAVPAIYARLTGLPEHDRRPDTSSLRLAVCGAAPMPAELIERFEQRYGVPVVEGYGLSEGTCASTLNPVAGPRKPGTVGLPLTGQRVELMDPQGRLVTDGPGEVVIKGPNVMRGYLGRPEETEATITDGWLRTGDVGRFDDDGYLVLVDRIKDLIIRGGENLYPKEIENALHAHPAVLEAAVVGSPDPVLGEVPVAVVALYPEARATAEELTAHCRERLAKVKVPVRITLVDALPKNPVGKIDKPALRDRPAPAG
ncbi:acyl-CoA synthetase (AMP-forming)/AMP-acid ligase II [Streptomyces sp. Amel2xB2]|uniref:class I adenylate-forming enzyme family protein n=1 Tax=Streptomyces sp. Amel2xB2 TaxID=1305829 RepID=UPI000DB93C82|nr:AMP-binding protein [Streptomyces sp. Amel2xB2]RAJ62462.1 acyl-CoA synthetase (AMP-forming)/AMP-acid ligase II [Streptomyces sp. Amel2xB2]